MSWGCEYTGSREAVAAALGDYLDKAADNYKNSPESADILACKERALALIAALDLTPDSYGTKWNAVKVKANGSHSWSGVQSKLVSGQFTLSVERAVLTL